jgi:DNA-binding XRE family transcriptional regulator
MENKKIIENKLYRWYNNFNHDTLMDNINWSGFNYYNYTNSFDFAKEHWSIVIEYDVLGKSLNMVEEDINQRLVDPIDYDAKINNNCVDWYRWYVSKWKHYNFSWKVYHYRVNKRKLKIRKIYFISENIKENISSLVEVTRLYLWLSQKDFADKLWLKQSKILEYENGKRELSVDLIIRIASLLDIEQSVKYKNTILNIKQW